MSKHIVDTNWFQNTATKPSVAEKIIIDILKAYKVNFAREISFVGLKYKSGYHAKFDFLLIDFNICIEYDGEQYHSSDNAILHDRIKNNYCKQNNITLIRYSKSHYYRLKEEIYNLVLSTVPVISPFVKVKTPVFSICKSSLENKKKKNKKREKVIFEPTPKTPSLGKKRREEQQKINKLKAKGTLGLLLPKGMTEEEYKQKMAAIKQRAP